MAQIAKIQQTYWWPETRHEASIDADSICIDGAPAGPKERDIQKRASNMGSMWIGIGTISWAILFTRSKSEFIEIFFAEICVSKLLKIRLPNALQHHPNLAMRHGHQIPCLSSRRQLNCKTLERREIGTICPNSCKC